MTSSERRKIQTKIDGEIGAVRKNWSKRLRVALIYPNTYPVGMSNLGFQTVYGLFNQHKDVVCERVFSSGKTGTGKKHPLSLESGRPLSDFDILAFSLSYENDYPNMLDIMKSSNIPFLADRRSDDFPLVLCGGVAPTLNPEPIAPFMDLVFIGEAEPMLNDFLEFYNPQAERKKHLRELVNQIVGLYAPVFYRPIYDSRSELNRIEPLTDVPATIRRRYVRDLRPLSTCSKILTSDSAFQKTFLIEISRGCPHGCRFCAAGFIYRPPRFRPIEELHTDLLAGLRNTNRIGLVGAAISDHPELHRLCTLAGEAGADLSFSSLRADAISGELIGYLRESRVKTATIAPDAGSDRMRRVINKGLLEDSILTTAEALVSGGIPNLKLYFMVGLPTETSDDVEAIVSLCKKIKHSFLKSSRARKRIGEITVGLNCFVPKPVTPFQWSAMDDLQTLKKKQRRVKEGLKRVANVRVLSDVPRWAAIQALLSRGDRRIADLLWAVQENGGNWPQALKNTAVNADYYVLRERKLEETLPWDLIDHGIEKAFLWKEYQRALEAKLSPPLPANRLRLVRRL